jgi:rod shape-determining protein MreC
VTEKRTRLLLVVLVLGQLLLVSAQVPAADSGQSLLAGSWLRVVAPFAAGIDAITDGVALLAIRWTTRHRLLDENARLRRENEALRRQAVADLGIAADLERLARAVDYTRATGVELQLADVVYSDRTSWLRTLLLRLGRRGVERNQPVITDDGLVGRIISVSGRYAKVQLITDRVASVGVMVARTRRQGVVRGASAEALALQYIPLQEDLVIGDEIVTAGIDGVYPRGIAVGTVSSVRPGNELFYEVAVRPAVDLSSIDHVYILAHERLPEELLDARVEPEEEPCRGPSSSPALSSPRCSCISSALASSPSGPWRST